MDNDSTAAIRQRLQRLDQEAALEAAGREARVQAGLQAYENARIDGLCHDGAWECALEAMREFVTDIVIPYLEDHK